MWKNTGVLPALLLLTAVANQLFEVAAELIAGLRMLAETVCAAPNGGTDAIMAVLTLLALAIPHTPKVSLGSPQALGHLLANLSALLLAPLLAFVIGAAPSSYLGLMSLGLAWWIWSNTVIAFASLRETQKANTLRLGGLLSIFNALIVITLAVALAIVAVELFKGAAQNDPHVRTLLLVMALSAVLGWQKQKLSSAGQLILWATYIIVATTVVTVASYALAAQICRVV